jgi:acetyltransferase-like isoleucine patch superfamily enzyme
MFLVTLFKATRKLKRILVKPIYTPAAKIGFYLNGAKVDRGLSVLGFIKIDVTRKGSVNIGRALKINSGNHHNVIGRQQKCIFWVDGDLNIGDNFAVSATAIICTHKITIGNNVTIGGNTVIYDTDFHNLDPNIRNTKDDNKTAKRAPVFIKDNVFIGAHTTILKGVIIGENSIIGACSVVTKSIPANEIWGGNPAKFIRKMEL